LQQGLTLFLFLRGRLGRGLLGLQLALALLPATFNGRRLAKVFNHIPRL